MKASSKANDFPLSLSRLDAQTPSLLVLYNLNAFKRCRYELDRVWEKYPEREKVKEIAKVDKTKLGNGERNLELRQQKADGTGPCASVQVS